MTTKTYRVRGGFVFSHDGKDYAEGESVKLREAVGNSAHQLELAGNLETADADAPAAEQPTEEQA